MQGEFYQYEGELWFNSNGNQEKIVEGSKFVDIMIEEISSSYPKAYEALQSIYKEAIINPSYYRFLIVRRFCKCNFALLDNKLDVENGDFNFEHISCPLRGECKVEGVVCHPEFSHTLSKQELRVLELLYKGKRVEQIADILYISVFTVKNHIKHAYKRLGVHSEAEFVRYAQTKNLFE